MSNVIDFQDPGVIAAATKTLMYEKGLYWSRGPAWRAINSPRASELKIESAIFGTMATFLSDEEVVVGPAQDEVQFWLKARQAALETAWDDTVDSCA